MTCGIYCIENKLDHKKYIGQSQNIEVRIRQYHKGCSYLINAIEKYGKESFKYYVLESCSKELLHEREIYWINALDSHVSKNGYNISYGGSAPMRDRKHSDKTKKKMSKDRKKEKHPLWKRPVSLETRLKQSRSHLGYKHSPESIEKNRRASTGRRQSESSKNKNRLSKLGIPRTDELKKKVSKTKLLQGVKSEKASSVFHGVRKQVRGNSVRFRASIRFEGRTKDLGSYAKEEDAARAYDSFIIENDLQNVLNFS